MSDVLKVILVDDEHSSLQNLQQKLEEFCPEIMVLAAVTKPQEGLMLIRHHKPDVIFLDIEMPRMNGFRMLEELGETDAEIVFITAYNNYAIEAIRISAFDYLVKPVSIEDLQHCVGRLITEKNRRTGERLQVLRNALDDKKSQENKIAVPTHEGLEFIVIRQIVRIESHAAYSRIYFLNGQSLLVTKLLKDFEELLAPYRFFRVHNSHLVNMAYIRKYIRGEGGQVVMENGDVVDVARRKKEDFLSLLHL
ncbi:MAG TPA: LytTR family DNA-binding domain-containing protein [Puia sp.]|nr:LytTR family DNA-binding domain-containing protein [Puia sp.]